MNPNLTPTEEEITESAQRLFPINLQLQMSYTLGVWKSILNTKNREIETAQIKAGNINNA
jgi:hypothetical protein